MDENVGMQVDRWKCGWIYVAINRQMKNVECRYIIQTLLDIHIDQYVECRYIYEYMYIDTYIDVYILCQLNIYVCR